MSDDICSDADPVAIVEQLKEINGQIRQIVTAQTETNRLLEALLDRRDRNSNEGSAGGEQSSEQWPREAPIPFAQRRRARYRRRPRRRQSGPTIAGSLVAFLAARAQ